MIPNVLLNKGIVLLIVKFANKTITSLNQEQIDNEAKYDGLYAVCTNLEYDVSSIIKIH